MEEKLTTQIMKFAAVEAVTKSRMALNAVDSFTITPVLENVVRMQILLGIKSLVQESKGWVKTFYCTIYR